MYEGEGILLTYNTCRAEGMFSKNLLNGKGVKAFLDGTILVSEFKDAKIGGNTNLIFKEGTRIEGEFDEAEFPHSSYYEVKFYREDGRVFEGRIENFTFVNKIKVFNKNNKVCQYLQGPVPLSHIKSYVI